MRVKEEREKKKYGNQDYFSAFASVARLHGDLVSKSMSTISPLKTEEDEV